MKTRSSGVVSSGAISPGAISHGPGAPGSGAPGSGAPALPSWRLEEAKARFSEVVRLARDRGPQRVTVRGQDAVVVISAAEYARLAPAAAKTTLAALFGEGPLARMEEFEDALVRERSPVRELPEF